MSHHDKYRRCYAALLELVECKDLKDSTEADFYSDNPALTTEQRNACRAEYESRKSLAWEAARKAAAECVPPETTEQSASEPVNDAHCDWCSPERACFEFNSEPCQKGAFGPSTTPSPVAPRSVGPLTRGEAGDWIDALVLDIAELPDRTSPDDRPDMMLVTAEELRRLILDNVPSAPPSSTEALKGYPRDNALEAAKDEKVLSLVWKAAFGNERLDAPDQALIAHSFLAIASELEWRERCIAESANSTTLGQPWSAMSSSERAAFNQGYAQAESDAARSATRRMTGLYQSDRHPGGYYANFSDDSREYFGTFADLADWLVRRSDGTAKEKP